MWVFFKFVLFPETRATKFRAQLTHISAIDALQVLRYSALAAGLLYGGYHQSSLNHAAKHAAAEREYAHKEKLIEHAKAEWRKKTAPPVEAKPPTTPATGGMIANCWFLFILFLSGLLPLNSSIEVMLGQELCQLTCADLVPCSRHRSRRQPVRLGSSFEVDRSIGLNMVTCMKGIWLGYFYLEGIR